MRNTVMNRDLVLKAKAARKRSRLCILFILEN